MGVEVKKRERENQQGLIRRFTKAIQESRVLVRARKIRFKVRESSAGAQKKAALRKIEMRAEYESLKKLGKLEK